MRDLRLLDMWRLRTPETARFEAAGPSKGGAFIITSEDDKGQLRVIASADHDWEHVSVSRADRTPTWAEMCQVKRLFFKAHEVVMQLHPDDAHYVNLHLHCLHLWLPVGTVIPTPPLELV